MFMHTNPHMNPARLPPSLVRLPLVFDVVFGEPCLKKFFFSFEVALCFPLSFSAMFPLLSSDSLWGWEGNKPVWNKILAPHTLFAMCCTCELEKFSPVEAIVSCEIRVKPPHPPQRAPAKTLWSLSPKSSSLNKCLGSRVLMSFQAFIKHLLWGKRHSATSGMPQQICRVSLWLLALQRHNHFKAFTRTKRLSALPAHRSHSQVGMTTRKKKKHAKANRSADAGAPCQTWELRHAHFGNRLISN